jgi:DNA-3-methyladenine glycosylase II
MSAWVSSDVRHSRSAFRDSLRVHRNIAETRFRISPKGTFSLAASARFLEDFIPAGFGGGDQQQHLHIAFPVEGKWDTVAVCVRQPERSIAGEIFGDADRATVRRHVARIFSLDVDGSGFDRVGRRDPIVGRLQKAFPGLRPVLFWSPYEAAAWTIIGHRIRMTQASRIKQRMAEELGEEIEVHGDLLHAFPGPQALVRMRSLPGLTDRKIERLRDLGRAALNGRLDSRELRTARNPLDGLKQLPGIGDFSAELILVRGAGEPDYFPRHERRLHRAMASAYGFREVPPVEVLAEIAGKWRPYRSWVSLLFRASLAG